MSAETQTGAGGSVDLRLRGDPPRVMRLSRKALLAAGLVVATGIGGALVYALQPAGTRVPTELYGTETRGSADTLAGAPKDYAQVPKLGPPLPGDLGRPILSAQQRGMDVAPPATGAPGPAAPPAVTPADAARERALQERDAAKVSKLFLGGEGQSRTPTASAGPAPTPAAAVRAQAPADPTAMSGQEMKRNFLRPGDVRPSESGFRLGGPSSPYLVHAGSVIPAALLTGIRSDLPGTITAQVTQNVYDSVTGRHLLIPQGSRLIGEYDAQISFGQNRVLLAWDRLILPDGRSLQLDRLPGSDLAGRAGLEDRVNQHWGGMLRAALISTLLGIGTGIGSSDDDDLIRAIRRGTTDSIERTGQDLVRRQMNVQPTLTIRPGFQLRIIVTRDLVLEPIEGGIR